MDKYEIEYMKGCANTFIEGIHYLLYDCDLDLDYTYYLENAPDIKTRDLVKHLKTSVESLELIRKNLRGVLSDFNAEETEHIQD